MSPEWFKEVSFHALAHAETSEATFDIARSLIERNIPGDFVECGVYAGAQAAFMARALQEYGGGGRKVHLFDSFEGIPAGGEHDHELKHNPAGMSACSLHFVQQKMRDWGIPESLLVYHPGFFDQTVPAANIKEISFLRLDGDLYDSTKVCMEHFYPKLTRGAWFCVDDFNLNGCRKAVLDYCIPAPVYWRIPTK